MGTIVGTDVTSFSAVWNLPFSRVPARERGTFTSKGRYLLCGFAVMVYSGLTSWRSLNPGNYCVNALILFIRARMAVLYL